MVVFRLLALLIVVAALMLLGADVVTTLESGEPGFTLRSIADIWAIFQPDGPAGLIGWAETMVPAGAVHALNVALSAPGWAAAGVFGLLIAVIFRRRDEDDD